MSITMKILILFLVTIAASNVESFFLPYSTMIRPIWGASRIVRPLMYADQISAAAQASPFAGSAEIAPVKPVRSAAVPNYNHIHDQGMVPDVRDVYDPVTGMSSLKYAVSDNLAAITNQRTFV